MTSQIRPNSVFVTGASGYIGLAVAQAFRKAGYIVYGLIRSQSKISLLQANEILPVIGDMEHWEKFKDYIVGATIVIDCASTYNLASPEVPPIEIFKIAEEASRTRDPLIPPKTYIYTSGVLVYDHDERTRDESWPLSDNEYSIWRRKVEKTVIRSPHINGVVIRPAGVFGGSGGPFSQHFEKQDKVVIYGVHKNRKLHCIYIDDLAQSYLAAAKKIHKAKGLSFNITNGVDVVVYAELIEKAARLAGYKGDIHWEPSTNWLQELFDASVILSPQRAIDILEWTPKVFGLLDNLEIHYAAYLAHKL